MSDNFSDILQPCVGTTSDTVLAASILTAALISKLPSADAATVQTLLPDVYATVLSLNATGGSHGVDVQERIANSIQQDYLVCLEDGKQLRMLKRHLRTRYNMSPEQYRKKWGLPASYPMTAPAYARARSVIAKQCGLGKTPTTKQ